MFRLRGPLGHYAYVSELRDLVGLIRDYDYQFEGGAFRLFKSGTVDSALYRCYLSPPTNTFTVVHGRGCEGRTTNPGVLLGYLAPANARVRLRLYRFQQTYPQEIHFVTIHPQEKAWFASRRNREERQSLGYVGW